jgi:hypothetical protein
VPVVDDFVGFTVARVSACAVSCPHLILCRDRLVLVCRWV